MKVTKRSNKHNAIYQYKNTRGTFWGYRLKYYDDDGKRKEVKQSKFDSEREAFEHLMQMQSDIDNGRLNKNNNITVGDWYQNHMNMNKPDDDGLNGHWSLNTYINREVVFRQYIKPLIGHVKMDKLTLHLYQSAFINELRKTLSASTVDLYHTFMIISVNAAVKHKIIKENPIIDVVLPEDRVVKEDKFIDVDELQLFLKDMEKNDNITNYTIAKFMAFSALRIGELRALKWKYVDFDKLHVKIYASMTKNKYGLTKGKNKRIVPVDQSVMQLLSDYRKWCIKRKSGILNEEDYVFISEQNGSLIGNSTFTSALQRSNERTGLNIKPHTLRHTHSAILIMQNRSLKAISKRLGNSEEVLRSHYGHVIDSVDLDTMSAFSEALEDKAGAETEADNDVVQFKR